MRERFEVKPEGDRFGLFLDGKLIGTSKAHCDCDFARELILKAVEGEENVGPTLPCV